MTLCPVAVVAGCQKCPAFKICPLKSVIGDMPADGATKSPVTAKPKAKSSKKT